MSVTTTNTTTKQNRTSILKSQELERTPGMVAVSGVCGRGVSGGKLPTPLQQILGGGGGTANLPLRQSQLLLNKLPDKDGVGDTSLGCLSLKSGEDIVGQPDGDPDGASSFCHSVGHYSQSYGKSQPGDYLDTIANVSSWLALTCEKKGWFVAAECENGHRFAKEIACGKEWCLVCGEDGSVAHLRRFARWLPKAQQFEVMGYFVFTIPQELRAKYRTKKALSKLGHRVQELLKAFGYSRGLRRWHWFGDKSTKYHPHLNCLVDGGFVSPAKLDTIKRGYATLLGADVVDVNYRYRLSPGKMVHSLKYVTRATFRDYELDLGMALELRGFRNMVVWGRGLWNDEAAWSLADLGGEARAEVEDLDIEAIEALVEKRCPVCGEPLTWGEALPIGLLAMVDKQPLGAGYYRLADMRSPPALSQEAKQRLYWLEVVHRAEVKAAQERAEAEAKAEAEVAQGWWAALIGG